MCVGTQPPRAPGSALLLLGLVLSAAAQPHCTGDTYPSGNRCCKECQPGYGMESRCIHNRDTVCSPCKPGYYNEAVNYEPCKPCTQCSQRSGSEPKQRCTPTRDTVCGCRPGSQPQDSYGYKRGVAPELSAVLGLGLGLGLLAPVAAMLALLLHHRAWRLLTNTPKPPGGNSFRTPIQEEHTDANSSLAKI
uniref:TNF receptor superfamily member 4 n=1 Tax=Ovis aries TaxID=9940 RepID=A0AC11EFV9_SHEEP